MKLKSSPKIFNNYKCDYPENTIKRIRDGFKKVNIDPKYKEVMIFNQGNFSVATGVASVEETGYISEGKGINSVLSMASAYAEMAERFSSRLLFPRFSNTLFSRQTVSEMENFIGKDIFNKFFNFSYLSGYVDVSGDNLQKDIFVANFFKKFPNYLSEGLVNKMDQNGLLDHWVDAYSLSGGLYEKIPLKFIRTISGSNGLGAGNTIEEAIVQAINEVFERYVAITVIKNKIEIPTISIGSIKDEAVLGCINFFKSINFDVIIKDFSMGNILPCIGVLFINNNCKDKKNQLKNDLFFRRIRVGAHLDRNQALIRCFTEELQGFSMREFILREFYDFLWDYWVSKMGGKYNPPPGLINFFRSYKCDGNKLDFLEKGDVIPFNRLFSFKNNDCLEEINKLVEICNKNKWEVLVVDETHPIINFPTVRVVMPPISFILEVYSEKDLRNVTIDDIGFGAYHALSKGSGFFIHNNDWLKSKEEIKNFIQETELYLSAHLFYPFIDVDCKRLNLFHLMAFANLATENYQEALNYFSFLGTMDIDGKGVDYKKISDFLRKDIIPHLAKSRLKRSLSAIMSKPIKNKIKEFFRKNNKCFEFYSFSPDRNPFQGLCNNCDKRCGQNFYKAIKSSIKTFFPGGD